MIIWGLRERTLHENHYDISTSNGKRKNKILEFLGLTFLSSVIREISEGKGLNNFDFEFRLVISVLYIDWELTLQTKDL